MNFLNSFPPVAQSSLSPYFRPVLLSAASSAVAAVAIAIFTCFASLITAGTASITLPVTLCALFAAATVISMIALYLILRSKQAPPPTKPDSPIAPDLKQKNTPPVPFPSTKPDSIGASDPQLKTEPRALSPSNSSPTKSTTSSETDQPSTLSKLTLSANTGEPEAMYALGMHLLNDSEDKDVESAIKWLELADEKNYTGVKLFLSNYYFDKVAGYLEMSGALADEEEIAKLYMQAASKGHAEAQYEYAVCCLEGKGTDQNEEMALNWLIESSRQNFMPATLKLGLYFAVKDNPEDKEKGMDLIRQAAENKLASAEFTYGMGLKQGIAAAPNPQGGLEWIAKAANQNLTEAVIQLALCNYHGHGCPEDHSEALKLFKQAAVQGSEEAKNYISEFFPNEDV